MFLQVLLLTALFNEMLVTSLTTVSPANQVIDLTLLTNYPSAVCLDGTPAGYYFRPSSSAESTKWMLYMEGGGWCWTPETCFLRSQMPWGSSSTWPRRVNASDLLVSDGPQSTNCSVNPTFCDFNYIFVRYCDGNSFSGFRTEPLRYSYKSSNGTLMEANLFFRGKHILNSVLEDVFLSGPHSRFLAAATEFVVQGCSAGGLATYLHADDVRDWLLPRAPFLEKFGSIPWSGFFLDHPNIVHEAVYQHHIQSAYELSNASFGVSSRCAAELDPIGEGWRCNMAPYAFARSTVPTFVVNSKVDAWQATCILDVMPITNATNTFMGGNCSAVPGYECMQWGDVKECNATQMKPLLAFQDDFSSLLFSIPTFSNENNGVFVHACYTHCEVHNFYDSIRVRGVSMSEAVDRWWKGLRGAHSAPTRGQQSGDWHVDCDWTDSAPFYCNPTCPYG
jgi:hypothetical protein